MGKESQSVGVRASNREVPGPLGPETLVLFFPLQAASGAGQQARPHIIQPHLLASQLTKHSSLGVLDSQTHLPGHCGTVVKIKNKKKLEKIFLVPGDHSRLDQLALAADSDNQTISSREEAVKLQRTRMSSAPLICSPRVPVLRPEAGVRRGSPVPWPTVTVRT